jgi:hypothetical protein
MDYASANANASSGVDFMKLYQRSGASAEADVARAEGDVAYDTPSVTVEGVALHDHDEEHALASVGAQAHAGESVEIGPSGVAANLNVGASVGARVDASASDSIRDAQGRTLFGVTANVHGTAGAEADAHLDVSFKDGDLHLGFGLGAALGLGGGFDFGIDIDPGAIADDAWKMLKTGASDVANAIEGAANDVKDAVVDAAKDVGHAFVAVGHAIGTAATDVAHAIGSAATDVADAIGSAAKTLFGWL